MRHLRHQYPASLTELTSVLESCQRILKTLSRIKMFNKVLLIQRVMFVGITIEEWQAVFRHMASQHNNQCRMYSIVAV